MESDDQTHHDTQSYMCFPLSQIDKSHLEAGYNIILPASAVSSSSRRLVCRMTFRIAKSNDSGTRHYHCGVAEFIADEGFVFLPTWMMKKLNIREGDLETFPDQRTGAILQGYDTVYQSMQKLMIKESTLANKQQSECKSFASARRKLKRQRVIVNLPDEIIQNILARLPTKPLLRSRCVSAHWNRLVSDPYFIKARLRRKILLVAPDFYAIEDNGRRRGDVMVKLHYPFECRTDGGVRHIRAIGTFNGIVVLVVNDHKDKDIIKKPVNFTSHIILYNPFTGASEIIPDPYSPFCNFKHIYGFGYGANKDELKMVRFRGLTNNWNTCDVFNLKERSWSTSEILIKDAHFGSDAGTFLNGSLYWLGNNKIVALDLKEMVISEIPLPCKLHVKTELHLGTSHGCLLMITRSHKKPYGTKFNMRVMKTEQGGKNSWSKSRSLTLGFKNIYDAQIINLMDDGRILMMGARNDLVIYDTSKYSYRVLRSRPSDSDIHRENHMVNAIEYEESLISPSII